MAGTAKAAFHFFGVKRPVGLVLLAPPVKKAFRMNG